MAPANWREIKGGRDRRDQKGPPQPPIQMADPVEGDKGRRRHQHVELSAVLAMTCGEMR